LSNLFFHILQINTKEVAHFTTLRIGMKSG
jgi:hypothetical protein